MNIPHLPTRLRTILLSLIVVFSLAWTAFSWSRLTGATEAIRSSVGYMVALSVSEILFTAGAVIMLFAIGETLPTWHPIKLIRHLRLVRQELRRIASSSATSKLFGFGFWLNFAGAISTSLILMFGVIHLLPYEAWGLLVVISLDLLATFGWRIPVQLKRKEMKSSWPV